MSATMIKEFRLPDLGEGLTESEIVSWKVGVGDTVALNQIIAEVENQKTNHLLNALSVIINEFPALGTVIKGSFGDEL